MSRCSVWYLEGTASLCVTAPHWSALVCSNLPAVFTLEQENGFNVCGISCNLSRVPTRKAMQTMEVSTCQLLVAISSRLSQLRIWLQNKYIAGDPCVPHVDAGSLFRLARYEAVGPLSHVHFEIYGARKQVNGWYTDSCRYSLRAEEVTISEPVFFLCIFSLSWQCNQLHKKTWSWTHLLLLSWAF